MSSAYETTAVVRVKPAAGGRRTDLVPDTTEQRRRPARVALRLAQAYLWQDEIDSGQVEGPAEIADRDYLCRPRVSQTMALLWLAPDIQEEVLHLEAIDGAEPLGERQLRTVTTALLWEDQRECWADMRKRFWSRKRVRPTSAV